MLKCCWLLTSGLWGSTWPPLTGGLNKLTSSLNDRNASIVLLKQLLTSVAAVTSATWTKSLTHGQRSEQKPFSSFTFYTVSFWVLLLQQPLLNAGRRSQKKPAAPASRMFATGTLFWSRRFCLWRAVRKTNTKILCISCLPLEPSLPHNFLCLMLFRAISNELDTKSWKQTKFHLSSLWISNRVWTGQY